MFFNIKKNLLSALALGIIAMGASSCNKEFEDIDTPTTPQQSTSAGSFIETDANYSLLKAAVTKAGLLNQLKTSGTSYTVFAPDNAAFTASGITSAHIEAMSAAQLQGLLRYHIIPQRLASANIPENFPNVQMPTILPLLATNPLVKMSTFPSRRGNMLFVNNIPVTQADINVGNGVVHKVARIVAPPTKLVAQVLAEDTTYSFFRAAISRADSGQVGLNRIDSVMKFGLANITVFAPTNEAFRQLLTGLGLPPMEAAFNFMPVQSVRGIVAYHILLNRTFGVNLPATTTGIQTLLGASPMPALTVDRSEPAPRLLGAGNGGRFANFVTTDFHAVNGVVHKIDMVLIPR